MEVSRREAAFMISGLALVAIICALCYFEGGGSGAPGGAPSMEASAKGSSQESTSGQGSYSDSQSSSNSGSLSVDTGKLNTSLNMPSLTSGYSAAGKN